MPVVGHLIITLIRQESEVKEAVVMHRVVILQEITVMLTQVEVVAVGTAIVLVLPVPVVLE